MKRVVLFATLSLALVFAVSAIAGPGTYQLVKGDGTLHGEAAATAKASRDTTYLVGHFNVDNPYSGAFEDQFGNPNWQGWEHRDITLNDTQRWNVSDFLPITGLFSNWCGGFYSNACADGYGNDFSENLIFTYAVANPAINTNVTWQAAYASDTEPGFDYFKIQMNEGGVWTDVAGPFDDVASGTINLSLTFEPADYVNGNELQLRFRGESDGAWSDEDCLWDTNGLARVDDITVDVQGRAVFTEDFEDGTSDDWVQIFEQNVGDFAQLWVGLEDIDPCRTNFSSQVAFIDDGQIVPGTGGSPCVTWCYGPFGFIVNCTGGLAGETAHLNNILTSPYLEWPAGAEGAYIEFEVYRHETLSSSAPGIFYQWHVRSVNTGNPADLEDAAWQDRNFVYYGGPDYIRSNFVVTDLLAPGRTHVQMALRCIEYGWVWTWDGVDGYPAPYFDNAAFVAYPFGGPGIATREIDIANDNFPERGVIDLVNLENNWVRFDMARNISPAADLRNDPGDSIFFDIGLPRAGSVLDDMPKMHFKIKANDLFRTYRMLPPNTTLTAGHFADGDDLIEGWVYGDSTFQDNGTVVADRYNFDLPDTMFLYAGDRMHYYIEAKDNVAGDVGTTIIPGDGDIIDGVPDGYGDFDGILAYPSSYIVRGLPRVVDAQGNQPKILLWNDFANRGGENEWMFALANLGYFEGSDFDLYYTNGPSSGVGNGIGGRATFNTLENYDVLLYTVGDLDAFTLTNGDFNNDPGDDLAVLDGWFQLGTPAARKKAFFTGDGLSFDLTQIGGNGLAFAGNYFSTRFIQADIAPLIGNQSAPIVRPIAGNSLGIPASLEYIAYGGCPIIKFFDAIEPAGSAERIAEFLDPNGNPGAYTYSALQRYVTDVSDVVLSPVDLMQMYNAPGFVPATPGVPARAELLSNILVNFGCLPGGAGIDVPVSDVFAVSNFPNPFNPATKIQLNLPKAGHVSVKIFNVRGELVRTVQDGHLAQGSHELLWSGETNQGSQAASGVYFYETRYNGEVKVNKMALVK